MSSSIKKHHYSNVPSGHSRSPSPEARDPWLMETDALIQEIEKLDKLQPPAPAPALAKDKEDSSVTKLSTKLNGATVTVAKKPVVKDGESVNIKEYIERKKKV